MNQDSPSVQTLKEAAQKKRAATFIRVKMAIETMKNESMPINFESVAKFAQASKTWLYANSEIATLIKDQKLSNQSPRQRQIKVSATSTLEQKVKVLTKQNIQLRSQIDELKKQLEVAYAELYKKEY